MHQKVARIVAPMAATFAVTAAGTGAWAAGGTPARQPGVPGTTACPAELTPNVPAIPGASPSGAAVNPASLQLALTAHGTRTPDGDTIEYRISAQAVRPPLHDITVTVRLTCVPGSVSAAGRPWASAGEATLGRRAVTWRLDLTKAPATAGFAVRLRPNSHGGPLVGEIAAAGPVSNCPALRAADTPVDPYCRATILISGVPATAAHPHHAAPARVRPAVPPPPAIQGGRPITQGTPAFPHVPALPNTPPLPPAPPQPAMPPAGAAPGAAGNNGVTAPGALPVVPPAPAPSPTVLSQLDRAPIVPGDPADAATQEPAPQASALRSGDTSAGDLSGRAFAFLIGGASFLLIATAIAGSLIGARLRRRADEDEAASTGLRSALRLGGPPPRTDGPRAGRTDDPYPDDRPPRTIVDVVRRTSETRNTDAVLGADPAGRPDRPLGRTMVDE
jgi:hypothetical protein